MHQPQSGTELGRVHFEIQFQDKNKWNPWRFPWENRIFLIYGANLDHTLHGVREVENIKCWWQPAFFFNFDDLSISICNL